MKIAVAAPTAIPARRANTIQVMKMTQALAGLGHEVRLAAPGPGPELNGAVPNGSGHSQAGPALPDGGWEALAHHYGLRRRFPVVWLPSAARLRRYDYGLRAVLWARGWGAELLYTRLPQAAAIASLAGMPAILEVHDLPQGRLGPLVFRLFLRGRGARRLVAITDRLARDLAARFGSGGRLFPAAGGFTVVAPDGVDLSRYDCLPAPEEARAGLPQLQGRAFVAGYTGHLYPGRGISLLLELAARLPQITFLLAGGEPQEVAELRVQVESRGLANVVLAGFVPNAELPRYQAACDALLMPYQARVAASSGGDISRYLSPMKLFEYLACGRAILSSDLPVLREVLTPEIARLLPPDDAGAWAAALQELRDDPQQRAALGAAARREAGRYSWEARAGKILEGLTLS